MEDRTDMAALNPQFKDTDNPATATATGTETPFPPAPPRIDTSTIPSSDSHSAPHTAPAISGLAYRRMGQTGGSGSLASQAGDATSGDHLRRSSSAMSYGSTSPKLSRKGSRASLGAQTEQQERRPTPKRSISNLIAGLRETHSTMEVIEEPIQLTAPQIANQHFKRELLHHGLPETHADAVVILHDACYGHRWSRLKTTKTTLSMIVERPERLRASALGISTAYVRLGEHHAEGMNAPHPENMTARAPPFKIRRTNRTLDITSPFVTNVHGTEWMSELKELCSRTSERLADGQSELARATASGDTPKDPLHEGDLYLAAESLAAFQGALGGVADAVDIVFDPTSATKRAFVAVRPPGHHCSADHPSGFCWLNNVHVGIEYAAQIYGLTHAAILDFDLHHGDGSQTITWERNSKNNVKRLSAKPNAKTKLGPDIGYYSIHDINSYPCEMGDDEKVSAASLCIEDAHGQNVWNVHLQPWSTMEEFWELYETRYRVLLDKAKTFLRQQTARLKAENKIRPKAAIFISAGFDASEWEGAGMQRHNVSVPTEFYARFTRDTIKIAQDLGTSCDERVISVLEGGYSDRAINSGILSHLCGLCASPSETQESLPRKDGHTDLNQLMRGLAINKNEHPPLHYSTTWWSNINLTALENKINPTPPPPLKKGRTGPQPTYATPTESFAYKVVDTDRFARSISGTLRDAPVPTPSPILPPPKVDWVISTQELCGLLIPADRQTISHTAEELGGVKPRKEKPVASSSLIGSDNNNGRQLRDRAKAKVPTPYAESGHSDELDSVRSISQSSNRRKTMHDFPSVSASDPPKTARRASRRLSAASTLSTGTDDTTINAPPVPALPTNVRANTMKPVAPASGTALQVKKNRIPPRTTKVTFPDSQSTQKRPIGSAKPIASHVSSEIPAVPSDRSSASINDMDSLATGMKKVTIKVGTREEHEKKQREREAAERRTRALKGAETRRLNAAARKAAKENLAPAPPAGIAGNLPPTSNDLIKEEMSQDETGETIAAVRPTNSGCPTNEMVPDAEVNPGFLLDPAIGANTGSRQQTSLMVGNAAPQTQGFTSSAYPEGVANAPTIGQVPMAPGSSEIKDLEDALRHGQSHINDEPLPPPLPSFEHASRLPVWSSTGVIPFAGAVASAPVSPVKAPPVSMTSNTASRLSLADGRPQTSKSNTTSQDGTSIWDVPLTPQRQAE